MFVFIVRRLVQALLVMLTVAFVAFMLFQYVGDPVTNLLGQDATQEQREDLRRDLGLDAPFPVQFARFVGNAVQGEFGLSLRQGRKVSSLIVERFPATLELSLVAGLIALVVGIPLGVYAALRRGKAGAQLLMMGSLLGVSLPTLLIGILLLNFPGKRRLEIRLIRVKPLKRGIDWIRRRAGRRPLELPEVLN